MRAMRIEDTDIHASHDERAVILIIDAAALNLQIIGICLHEHGFEIITAGTGERCTTVVIAQSEYLG